MARARVWSVHFGQLLIQPVHVAHLNGPDRLQVAQATWGVRLGRHEGGELVLLCCPRVRRGFADGGSSCILSTLNSSMG